MPASKARAIVALGTGLLALAGCGGAGSTATLQAALPGPAVTAAPTFAGDATAVCRQTAQTAAKGYGIQALVAVRSSTAGAFTAWHGPAPRRGGQGALDGKAASTPVTLCLYRSNNLAPPHPAPPPGSRAKPLVFDTVEILVTESGTLTEISMGQWQWMARRIRSLPAG